MCKYSNFNSVDNFRQHSGLNIVLEIHLNLLVVTMASNVFIARNSHNGMPDVQNFLLHCVLYCKQCIHMQHNTKLAKDT